MAWVTICPRFPRRVLAHACCPGLIANTALLKTVLVWSINYMITLRMGKVWPLFPTDLSIFSPDFQQEFVVKKKVSLNSEPCYFYGNTFFFSQQDMYLLYHGALYFCICGKSSTYLKMYSYYMSSLPQGPTKRKLGN